MMGMMQLPSSKLALTLLLSGAIIVGFVTSKNRLDKPNEPEQAELPVSESISEPAYQSDVEPTINSNVSPENSTSFDQDDDKSIVALTDASPAQSVKDIAKDFYLNADRTSFVKMDSEKYISNLRFSRAFMYAESGNHPATAIDSGASDFVLNLFDDRPYPLSVTNVDIINREGTQFLIVEGQVTNNGESVFRISSTGDGSMMSGYIDTPEHFTRFDTWKISNLTAVAEFERSTVEKHLKPID